MSGADTETREALTALLARELWRHTIARPAHGSAQDATWCVCLTWSKDRGTLREDEAAYAQHVAAHLAAVLTAAGYARPVPAPVRAADRDALATVIEGSGGLPAHASDQVNWSNARTIADAVLAHLAARPAPDVVPAEKVRALLDDEDLEHGLTCAALDSEPCDCWVSHLNVLLAGGGEEVRGG